MPKTATKTTPAPTVLALRSFVCQGIERSPGEAFLIDDPELILKLSRGGYAREITGPDSTVELAAADASSRVRWAKKPPSLLPERVDEVVPEVGLPEIHPEHLTGHQDRVLAQAVLAHIEALEAHDAALEARVGELEARLAKKGGA